MYLLTKDQGGTNKSPPLLENNTEAINENKNTENLIIPDEEAIKKEMISDSASTFSPLSSSSKLNCCFRYFGPIKQGSLRGSIFSLASICFDTTSLSFPYAFYITGLIPGTFIFFLIAALSFWSINLLLKSGRKKNIYNYRNLIETCLGSKMALVSDINNIIFTVGAQCAYIVTISRFFSESMKSLFGLEITSSLKAIQMSMSMVFFQIPLSMLKNVSSLQYASLAGSFVLIFAFIVMFMEVPFYFSEGKQEGRAFEFFMPVNSAYLDTFSLFVYGFCPHNGLFIILNELNRPDSRRSRKVISRAYYFQAALFLLIAYSGFFSLIGEVPSIFLSRPPLKTFDKDDYACILVKILFFISLHCLCAINFNLLRGTLKSLFFGGEEVSTWQSFIAITAIFIISNLISFFADNIVQIIGIISGISVVFICYVFPILCYVKSNHHSRWHYKNIICVVVMISITIFGLMSTVKSAMEYINS
jgi:hypothetical protein